MLVSKHTPFMVTLHNMWYYQYLIEIELYDPNVSDLYSNFIRFLFHSVHKFGYKSKQGWSSSQFQPAFQLTTSFPRRPAFQLTTSFPRRPAFQLTTSFPMAASYPYPSLPLSPSLTISDGEYNPPYSPPKRNPQKIYQRSQQHQCCSRGHAPGAV